VKQTIFMVLVTAFGTLGVFTWGPFVAVAVYYLYAVLRPQSLWVWAIPYGVPWSEFVAIAAIISAIYMRMQPTANTPPPPRPRSWQSAGRGIGPWALVGFGLWIFGSYLNAAEPDVAYKSLIEYWKIIVMFVTAGVIVRTTRHVKILYLIATITIGYIAYEMNYLYFVNGYLAIYRRGYGGLDNNGAGLMIAMGVPLAVHAWEAEKRRWRWLYIAMVPLMLHAVLMSYSRGAMIALLIAAPLMFLRTRLKWQMIIVLVLVGALIPSLAGQEIRDRFFTIQSYEQDRSANARFMSWNAGIAIANQNPILGVGPRNSNLLSYDYGADTPGRTIHSQYLQTAADVGWVGLAFYLTVILSALRSASIARRRFKRRGDAEGRELMAMASGAQCSLAVFLIGAFFLSLEVFELPYFLMFLMFALRRLSDAPAVENQERVPVVARKSVDARVLTPAISQSAAR